MSHWRWGTWDETLVLTWPELRSVLLTVVIIGGIAAVRYAIPGDWFADRDLADDPDAPPPDPSPEIAPRGKVSESRTLIDRMGK